ncbi:molybdenum ABC transporter substrate-binding protein [Streptomyces sp. NPDC059176]|uniref:molybdenum ABC transporter substrate-binding protein n=1 Tax=Streptomyces sp. NPDC059176 TaxID=3346758 RepID=UPI0036C57058
MKEVLRLAVLGVAGVLSVMYLAGCFEDKSPTNKEQVCTAYAELGNRVRVANGVIDNLVFRKAGEVGDLAERYEGSEDLSEDAEALHEIADSSTTTLLELMQASKDIAALCNASLDSYVLTP